MSAIFGALNLPDIDRTLVNQLGEQVVYDAVNEVLADHQAALDRALELFVAETTTRYTENYRLPGGGYLDRLGRFAPAGAAKGLGRWGVAYPLESWGRQIAGDRVTLAYMDVQELNAHIDTIETQNVNTTRRELLKALLDSREWEFEDERNGPLVVQPLANNDATVFPPLPDQEDGATDNHYLVSGYVVGDIDDTNNPIPTIRDEIAEHFGDTEDAIVFVPENAAPYVEALTDFDEVPDPRRQDSTQVDLTGLPANMPGQIIGRANHVWIAKWRWLPAGYLLGIDPGAPRPLKKRVHPPETGLPATFQLVAEKTDYPLRESHYENNFGFGVGNRLNGVVMQLKAAGTYDPPAGFLRFPL